MMAMLRRFIALLYGFNGLGAPERVQERFGPALDCASPTLPQLKTRWAIPRKANPAKRGRALGRVALQYSLKLPENNAQKQCFRVFARNA
jgi:hypothetical protein